MAKKSIYKTEKGKQLIQNNYSELLSDWVQPCKQQFIKTQLGDTFVLESGKVDAPAIILLHGSGSNSAMWMADAKILSEFYHVFAVDIVGECGKSAETRLPFKNNSYSDWLLEVINHLNISSTAIISNSLGGWIGLDFAIKFPERMNKLVLIATAGITNIRLKTVFWIIITSLSGQKGFDKLNQIVYGELEIDQQSLTFANLVRQHYVPRTDALPRFSNEQLQQIKCPVLFIGGENDCFYVSEKTAKRLEQNIENAKTLVLKNSGHVVVNQINTIIPFLKN
ncbi:alpha/beta hydrolase [uncultured Draconibacterium sp.]|uniref:alpha/beta fold hydrolase n=1 Tax=uncultured Draconibacterium sp. TaxID=1573823 RepID=UPI002AA8176A|nr:alpha/beta hydrolase [uncultured Draconibacterium sp.]